MIQLNLNPFLVPEIHHHQEELIREAALLRLAQEVKKTRTGGISEKSKVFVKVGRKLAEFGTSLQERYREQPEGQGTGIELDKPEGCS